ncbi:MULTISPECIES: arabinofuranosidase catalytic domain-containing protein [unclassified Paraburkholderia]|uniref:arabinofuranosidase catalytic domain-containing protein n=1 Tax=unclassified Paraburkholderia TaxID=2615204 RepID=UPI00161AE039|nr:MULTISPECIES: arabinofuranosidase catalytic domain-containing protein [unclassified Paraburkholderia]MBB5442953.1 hypothetical protein [Paraburkholderia sp. WSM4177]MBB5483442.1 hypothetical protein [Paraburkholderia sp. WSM4180]
MSRLASRLLMCAAQPYVGVLDGLSAWPAGAWSLRRLTGRYSGPAIRVVRTSDSATADIGFTPQGDLSVASLLAFAGGSSAAVSTWYDQSGYGRNMTQLAVAHQPLIVTAGMLNTVSDHSPLPGILAVGTATTSQYMTASAGLVISQPFSRVSVTGCPAGATPTTFPVVVGTSNQTVIALRAANRYYQMYDYTTGLLSVNAVRLGDANIVDENYNTTSSSIALNGAVTNGSVGSQDDGINQVTAGVLSRYDGASAVFGEVLQFGALLGASDQAALTGDQRTYWGTPGLLDILTLWPAGAWSLRRLTGTYTGPCLTVRRDSDQATKDIGFTKTGDLNIDDLLAFVGQSNGYVTTWYDQSGHGLNMTATLTVRQPLIVTNGVLNTASMVEIARHPGDSNGHIGAISRRIGHRVQYWSAMLARIREWPPTCYHDCNFRHHVWHNKSGIDWALHGQRPISDVRLSDELCVFDYLQSGRRQYRGGRLQRHIQFAHIEWRHDDGLDR